MTPQDAITAVSYDDRLLAARLVSWVCCRRTVWATRPELGCLTCR